MKVTSIQKQLINGNTGVLVLLSLSERDAGDTVAAKSTKTGAV
jgi:hypothetical protein